MLHRQGIQKQQRNSMQIFPAEKGQRIPKIWPK